MVGSQCCVAEWVSIRVPTVISKSSEWARRVFMNMEDVDARESGDLFSDATLWRQMFLAHASRLNTDF